MGIYFWETTMNVQLTVCIMKLHQFPVCLPSPTVSLPAHTTVTSDCTSGAWVYPKSSFLPQKDSDINVETVSRQLRQPMKTSSYIQLRWNRCRLQEGLFLYHVFSPPAMCTHMCCAKRLGSFPAVPCQGLRVEMLVFWSVILSTGVKIPI